MHRWNCSIMEWNFCMGLETTLPQLTMQGDVEPGKFQKLYDIRSVSLPGREGKIILRLNPSVNLFSGGRGSAIVNRFLKLSSDMGVRVYQGAWGKGAWPPLSFRFEMVDGEGFLDTSILLVKEIFKRSGVPGEHNYRLGGFVHKRQNFFKFENSWISLERYLRMQHKLPLEYPGDDERIILVNQEDLE